jgi:glucose-6-phosphate isomerase
MSRDVTKSQAWRALAEHADDIRDQHLRDLFAADGDRGTRLTAQAADLYVDYGKNLVTDRTMGLLAALADEVGLPERIAAMFAGEHINTSEDRAVLHTALRLPGHAELVVDGRDVVADVHAVLDKMAGFARRVREGGWRGHTGQPIATVVNIGIGGSDLGPVMAYEALRGYLDTDIR